MPLNFLRVVFLITLSFSFGRTWDLFQGSGRTEPVNRATEQPTNQPTIQPTKQPTQLTTQPVYVARLPVASGPGGTGNNPSPTEGNKTAGDGSPVADIPTSRRPTQSPTQSSGNGGAVFTPSAPPTMPTIPSVPSGDAGGGSVMTNPTAPTAKPTDAVQGAGNHTDDTPTALPTSAPTPETATGAPVSGADTTAAPTDTRNEPRPSPPTPTALPTDPKPPSPTNEDNITQTIPTSAAPTAGLPDQLSAEPSAAPTDDSGTLGGSTPTDGSAPPLPPPATPTKVGSGGTEPTPGLSQPPASPTGANPTGESELVPGPDSDRQGVRVTARGAQGGIFRPPALKSDGSDQPLTPSDLETDPPSDPVMDNVNTGSEPLSTGAIAGVSAGAFVAAMLVAGVAVVVYFLKCVPNPNTMERF